MKELDVNKLSLDAVDLWAKQWMVLTAGTIDDFNMMTVAWGSVGCMWFKPFVQVVVRPQRHTRHYMDKNESFTLCAFPEAYRKDLQMLGTTSGRDGDKLANTGLTTKDSKIVATPSYNEANFIMECRVMYHQDMDPAAFVDPSIDDYYPEKDYHRIYYGEILAAFSD